MDTQERIAGNPPRFVVAKYAPDVRRMEPRNFGVILWTQHGIGARFLGEKEGKVSPPRHLNVRSSNAYRQWVEYWRGKVDRGGIVRRNGEKILVDDPQFLTELLTKAKEQYMLVDGGVFNVDIAKGEIANAVDELFEELVAPLGHSAGADIAHQVAARTLKRSAKKAIKNARLDEVKGYYENFDYICPVGETRQTFHFDYAIHLTKPTVVMREIPLWKLPHVHSSAFQFTSMQSALHIPSSKCASLVYATEEDLDRDEVQEALKLMESISSVINVSDPEQAGDRLLSLVA